MTYCKIITDLTQQMIQGMAAMVAHLVAIVRLRLGWSRMLHHNRGLTSKIMRHLVADIERPALYVCRKDKYQ